MDDVVFDDFDVDALLEAQGSDDDGSDLPDLERSLDDILNDTEFADILGDSLTTSESSVALASTDTFRLTALGSGAIGLQGETLDDQNVAKPDLVDNNRLTELVDESVDLTRGECIHFDHLIAIDENSQRTSLTTDCGLALAPSTAGSANNASLLDNSLTVTQGSEITSMKRISSSSHNVWDSNGRASGTSPMDYLPQLSKLKSSPRPGAAFAAAAAASRHSTSPQVVVSRSLTKPTSPKNASRTLEVAGYGLDEDSLFESENFPTGAQVFGETVTNYPFSQKLIELDAEQGLTNDSHVNLENSNFLNSQMKFADSIVHTSVELNNELQLVDSHDENSWNLLSQPGGGEPLSGFTVSLIDPKSDISDCAPEIDNGLIAGKIGNELKMIPQGKDRLAEPPVEGDLEEPKLSDVSTTKSWIKEGNDSGKSGKLVSNFQVQESMSPASRRDSIRANLIHRKGKDEVEPNPAMFDIENPVDLTTQGNKAPEFTALHIAEELERNAASSGLHWEEGAVAQPMRLEGIQRGAPAIGLLQLDSVGSLSYALQNSALRREHGLPQALAVQSNFIAVGLSKGGILVIPSKYSATRSADETDAKHFVLATPGSDKLVSSMCFNQQGDLLLVGYSNGHLVLWDVLKASVIKTLEKEHSAAIVHTLFLVQDIPGARTFRAITSDSKGLTLLHTFTVLPVPVLRRYTVNTTCILDGQRTGIVLSVSPLLPEEGYQSAGCSSTVTHMASSVPMNLSSVMGVVGAASGADVGRKFLYDGTPSSEESGGGLVVFVTHQVALVVRLLPSVEVCARLSRPDGIREGAIPYTAWRRTKMKSGTPSINLGSTSSAITSSVDSFLSKDTDGRSLDAVQNPEDAIAEGMIGKSTVDGGENCPSLAIAWDRKVLIYKLPKSELKFVAQWEMDSPAVGVAWLEEQMMVVATSNDELCLFTNEGIEIERAVMGTDHGGMGAFIYHTHFMNLYGNPEKAHHNALAVRGAALYLLGPNQLWRARLLPWRDRIKALENAGDWMGAFHIAMEIYDGRSQGVTGLPRGLKAMREAIMPTLLALLSAYIDEAFAYLSLALGPSSWPPMLKMVPEPINDTDSMPPLQELHVSDLGNCQDSSMQEMVVEAREQYARVGGVAIEFCVHIRKTEVLFENVFSKFEAVGQRGTFLELLEPYILKDMLGGLAPEVMQALVEHYSSRGWLNRVEQCVLHMDISSLDFNQVVRVCRDHGLYSALIYLFTKGLDDFKSPLEELLAVAQNSKNISEAQAFGYKLLVYLKYCFNGLAFPPGNGSLLFSRLPKLRAELLGYLLDPNETCGEDVHHRNRVQDSYSRLVYLLKLDTNATLLVLGAAFPEDGPLGVGKRDWIHPVISFKHEHFDTSHDLDLQLRDSLVATGESIVQSLKLSQQTVDAIIRILHTTSMAKKTSISEDATVSSDQLWPTESERGNMLEFVAHFAAAKYAMVSKAIMSQILEHLTSPAVKGSEETKIKILKLREDLIVALLRAVPNSEWDMQQILQLAQKADFWQVTALLYAQQYDYTRALDSYLKDTSRPQHPFIFISHMLSSKSELDQPNLSNFQEAVLSRLPALIELSTQSTLFVVLNFFSNENQRVLRELAPHPRLLFNYLKAVMNVRSSGVEYSQSGLDMDAGPKQQPTIGSLQGKSQKVLVSGHHGEKYGDNSMSDSQVYLADLLHRSGLVFTDEMAETFVELLCQFEPQSVLRFLESYENCRLEHCLKLCQEYGITDAAAFLLERVGDVGSALTLVLADVRVSIEEMDQVVSWLVTAPSFTQNHEKSMDTDILNLPEVASTHSVLQVAVSLCQRNTFRLEPKESETLWFRLLDRFVEFLHNFNDYSKNFTLKKQNSMDTITDSTGQQWIQSRDLFSGKEWRDNLGCKSLRRVLVRFIGDIVNGMMGYVPLPIIMSKILEDHREHEFGDFKAIILDMLSAYGYERAILGTAKQLIEDDTFQNISVLKRGSTHAFSPIYPTCAICHRRLEELPKEGSGREKSKQLISSRSKEDQKENVDEENHSFTVDVLQQGIRIFPCGHATHYGCMEVESGSETRRSFSNLVCPVCFYNSKPIDLSFHKRHTSLLKGPVIEIGTRNGKQQDSIDYKEKESMVRMTNQAFRQPRSQLLKHLEKGTDLQELGLVLKLNLAPALAQYKHETMPYGGSARLKSNAKPSMASTSRGDNWLALHYKSKSHA